MQFTPVSQSAVLPEDFLSASEMMRLPRFLAGILYSRGIVTPEALEAYLHPGVEQLLDATAMSGMEEATALLEAAAENGDRICIYGDYDCDGVCGVAVLYRCLTYDLGIPDVQWYIPDRDKDGYGLHEEAIRKLAARRIKLLITVDCGITAVEEVALAVSLGMHVIITDHHELGERLPEADAIISPKLPGQAYANRDLCGAATAGKLTEYIAGRDSMLDSIDLIAMATIGDMVPLVGENRTLAAMGLRQMQTAPRPGIQALFSVCARKNAEVTSEFLSYSVVPCINAAGRVDTADQCVELLLSEDVEEAKTLAKILESLNNQRKSATDILIQQAEEKLRSEQNLCKDRGIVLWDAAWKPGLLGLAASQLMRKYHRPAIILGGDGELLHGSGRSVEGVSLPEAMQYCNELLYGYGGHEMAGGMQVTTENASAFRVKFLEYLSALPENYFTARESYDAVIGLSDVTLENVRCLQRMEPFGQGNPVPLFLVESVQIENLETMGSGEHFRMLLVQESTSLRTVAFRKKPPIGWQDENTVFHVILSLKENTFRGSVQLQAVLQSICSADRGQYLLHFVERTMQANRKSFWEQVYTENVHDLGTQLSPEEAVSLLQESQFGRLIVCTDPQILHFMAVSHTFTQALQHMTFATGTVPEGYEGENLLLLAPEWKKIDYNKFDKVLFADRISRIPNEFYGKELQKSWFGSIIWDNLGGWSREMEPPWDVNTLRKAYVFCRKFLQRAERYGRTADLMNALAAGFGCSRWQMSMALRIFIETGLFRRHTCAPWLSLSENNTKVELSSSPVWRRLQELADKVQGITGGNA